MPRRNTEFRITPFRTSNRPLQTACLLCILVVVASCSGRTAPQSTREALFDANDRINKVISGARAAPPPAWPELPPLPAPDNESVRFWYYAHPLIAKPFDDAPRVVAGTSVEPQFIGEWPVAVQKLLTSFAVDELPDVGMVKRDLVAKLYEARRIRPLDTVLPQSLLDDFRDEVTEDYTYDGHLVALPADGFCSVLYFNKRSVGAEPPRTWAFLTAFVNAERATPGPRPPRGLGAFPFLEALWSADGNVLIDGVCGLDRPEALGALDFVMEVTRGTLRAEASAFEQWSSGQLAMTVASSSRLPAAKLSEIDFGIAPVPGETGPIARRSNDAVVVFVRDVGASGESIAGFLEWLTGPQVMGESATDVGSVPIRKSLQKFESRIPGVVSAYVSGRNTPLHPDWGGIESELEMAISRAYQAADLAP